MSDAVTWMFGNEPIRWVQQFIGLGYPAPFRAISLLGDTWGIILVAGIGLWLFGRRTLHAIVGVVAAYGAVKLLLLDLVQQGRPEGPGIVVYQHLELSSFPSGHVFAAVAPWGTLYALGRVPLMVPVLVSVAVAIGRLYLGTHYLADVLAALVLGALLVWAYDRVWPRVYRYIRTRHWIPDVAVAAIAVAAVLATWALGPEANPRRFEIYGMVMAGAIALAAEPRMVRYGPVVGSRGSSIAAALIGAAGIVICLLWDRSAPEEARHLGIATAGLATFWALLIAPAVLPTLGLGRRGSAADAENGVDV